MNRQDLADYHLNTQAREIAEMQARTKSFETRLVGIDITVFPRVYPGGIDSELICSAIGDVAGNSVLDLCTGTGVVAVRAAQKGAKDVVAVDLNPDAVINARFNINKLALNHVKVLEGSLFEPVGDTKFDVIAINPPYTAKKPNNKTEICFWDEDNKTTKVFFKNYKSHLMPHGRAFLAWADFGSIELIEQLASQQNITLKLVESRSTQSGLAKFLVYELN